MTALNDPAASKVLGTRASDGSVNVIPVGSIMAASPELIAFGAILMKDTSKNLEKMRDSGELVSMLVSKETKAYQVKGAVKDYVTSGPLFDKMNEVLKSLGLQARGVWTVEPQQVWNQSANYESGKRMA